MESPRSQGARHTFTLGLRLGAGTFGEVYLARMRSPRGMEQQVAVKLLNRDVNPQSQPVARMKDEGRLLASVNHPVILQVLDFCRLDGRIGLVTEYVPGADLHDCIHGVDPLPRRAAIHVVGLVADALHAALEARTPDGQRLGLVHRDIKPANIRITPHGTVKLLDFGIAKAEDMRREAKATQRMTFGTPAYMAPEVLTHAASTSLPSRDVFALGCTLYEALAAERFFGALDHAGILALANDRARFDGWRQERLARLEDVAPDVLAMLTSMLSFDEAARPRPRAVADAFLATSETMEGPSLWGWSRARTWTDGNSVHGAWSGRQVVDTMAGDVDVVAPPDGPSPAPRRTPELPPAGATAPASLRPAARPAPLRPPAAKGAPAPGPAPTLVVADDVPDPDGDPGFGATVLPREDARGVGAAPASAPAVTEGLDDLTWRARPRGPIAVAGVLAVAAAVTWFTGVVSAPDPVQPPPAPATDVAVVAEPAPEAPAAAAPAPGSSPDALPGPAEAAVVEQAPDVASPPPRAAAGASEAPAARVPAPTPARAPSPSPPVAVPAPPVPPPVTEASASAPRGPAPEAERPAPAAPVGARVLLLDPADVQLRRGPGRPVYLVEGAWTDVPSGRVDVLAQFDADQGYVLQFSADLADGEELRVRCASSTRMCARR